MSWAELLSGREVRCFGCKAPIVADMWQHVVTWYSHFFCCYRCLQLWKAKGKPRGGRRCTRS